MPRASGVPIRAIGADVDALLRADYGVATFHVKRCVKGAEPSSGLG